MIGLGLEWKPPAAAGGGDSSSKGGDSSSKKKKSPSPQKQLAPVEWKGGPLSQEEKDKLTKAAADEIDIKIQNCGDHIRKLKGTIMVQRINGGIYG